MKALSRGVICPDLHVKGTSVAAGRLWWERVGEREENISGLVLDLLSLRCLLDLQVHLFKDWPVT